LYHGLYLMLFQLGGDTGSFDLQQLGGTVEAGAKA
jgi:hypothetical protein